MIKFAALFFPIMLFGQTKDITILYTHSGSGYLEACECSKSRSGGLPRRYTLIEEVRKKYPDAFLIDAGNFLSPQGLRSDSLYLTLLQKMNYDAVNISQYEIPMQAIYAFPESVSTNLHFDQPTNYECVIEKNGVRCLIVGITSQSALSLVAKSYRKEIVFVDPIKAIQERLQNRANEFDLVIVLLHSFDFELEKKISENILQANVIVSTNFAATNIVPAKINSTIIVGSPNGDEAVGELHVSFDEKTKQISLGSHTSHLLSSDVVSNSEIQTLITNFTKTNKK